MAVHVEIDRSEVLGPARIQGPCDRDGFEEQLGHDHRAAEIEHDAAVVDRYERVGQPAKVAVARVAYGGSVRSGMLMDDLGAERRMNCCGHAECVCGEQ